MSTHDHSATWKSRRAFLLGAAALTGVASVAYITQRGLRFPRLTLSPAEPLHELQGKYATLAIEGAIFVAPSPNSADVRIRAIQPELKLTVLNALDEIKLELDNIPPSAILEIPQCARAQITESINGLRRLLTIKPSKPEKLDVVWRFADERKVVFGVIGDSGGGDELPWCLARAAELGAEFMLHLGDFNYTRGEYDLAIEAFRNAAIPTYVTIGNHDFNDSGLVYQHFLSHVGRFNHRFTVAGTEFLNIDTSANFFPTKGGQRGRFIAELERNSKPKIAFSHRPFVDIRPGHDHNLGSVAEANWLHETFQQIACDTYLCGHVHKSGETDVNGLQQWTVGEGLGYEDWVARKPVSQLLMGVVEPLTPPRFTWASLDMPWSVHTSPKHLEKLLKEQPAEAVDWFHRMRAKHS